MKTLVRSLLAATALAVTAMIASQAGVAQVPAGAPAGTTGLCNDGSYWTGASKSGACRGHKGVKTWYAASAAAPTYCCHSYRSHSGDSDCGSRRGCSSRRGPAPKTKTSTASTRHSEDARCRRRTWLGLGQYLHQGLSLLRDQVLWDHQGRRVYVGSRCKSQGRPSRTRVSPAARRSSAMHGAAISYSDRCPELIYRRMVRKSARQPRSTQIPRLSKPQVWP